MEKKIGNFEFDSSFSRNNLTSKITQLVDSNYSVGLHAIGFTKEDKKSIAANISEEGIVFPKMFSAYYTVRFFGYPYRDDKNLNGYCYDQMNHNELAIVVAIPRTFRHSSGKVIEGGSFPYMSSSQAKKELNELRKPINLTDRLVKPIPKEFLLGCYTFDRNEVEYISETVAIPVDDGYGNITYRYQIDPCAKAILGSCDFYINPKHYERLSQEEKDSLIEKYFGYYISSSDAEEKEPAKVYTRRKMTRLY